MIHQAYEWDEAKRRSNLAKHGVDFLDAIRVFLDSTRLERLDDRFEYGEDRLQVIGRVGNQILFVVCTESQDTCRIISARKANRREQEAYDTHQD